MKFPSFYAACAAIVLSIACGPAVGFAQDRTRYPDEFVEGLSSKDDIPRIVLSTQKGRELVNQIKQLRIAESTFGPRHPSAKEVQYEIKVTKARLMAIAKEQTSGESDPAELLSNLKSSDLEESVSEMGAQELRTLVLRLIQRVDELQVQVEKLKADQ